MLSALAIFKKGIADARALTALHDFLKVSIAAPISLDDLLRSQLVYSVSAFDKLLHDLVRIGMVACFTGTRIPTPKYKSETISLEFHLALVGATIPPKEFLFEREIATKLRTSAYQDPEKVADGLSFIWDEKHKWQKIAASMGRTDTDVKTTLKLIATRRNAIVHESDIDPLSGTKNAITRQECNDVTDFLDTCGTNITHLVK